jgi:hypothetical protein
MEIFLVDDSLLPNFMKLDAKCFEMLVSTARDFEGIKLSFQSVLDARAFRRKLYRARVKMKENELKEFAFKLTFKLNGSSVEILLPTKISISSLEDNVNVSEDKPSITSNN